MFQNKNDTIYEVLEKRGISRRDFFKIATATTAMLGLEFTQVGHVIAQMETKPRVPVIWLHFQDCTGCSEAITRSYNPSLERLILNDVSLDYHETLMAAAGHQAEAAKQATMQAYAGQYVLVVEGSVPTGFGMTSIGGRAAVDILKEAADGAMAIISVGNCAAFGGIPAAKPNPTNAHGVWDLVTDKPVINVPGCPPIPEVMTNTIAHILILGTLPELDKLNRPKMFYAQTVHDRCVRRGFYDAGLYANSFGDEGYKAGYCLFKLGCKGPTTYNTCPSIKWNDGTSWPVEAGHPCLGCSEPQFWDAGGFYQGQSSLIDTPSLAVAAGAAAVGVVAGAGIAAANAANKRRAEHATPAQAPADNEEDKS
ncbi:MAG: hydrogenase small subunit [Anaerolineaceae bacterium]|nr:hydrogenase small subunit [Anaerolineaceae bacterium]